VIQITRCVAAVAAPPRSARRTSPSVNVRRGAPARAIAAPFEGGIGRSEKNHTAGDRLALGVNAIYVPEHKKAP
jgi:hypothetical protein